MNSNYSSNIRHSLVANSFYLYIAQFSEYLLSFLILPFIARKLGPIALGQVALAQTFGVFCLLFMEFGFPLTATRRVALLKNQKNELGVYIGEAISFKIVLIPILILLSIMVIVTVPIFQNNPIFILIMVFGTICQGLAPIWFFQGIERLGVVAISKIIIRLIGFGFIIVLVKSPNDGWLVLTAQSLTSFLILTYLIYKMKKVVGRIHLAKIQKINYLWKENNWGLLITTIPTVYQTVASLLMGTVIAPIQLGLLLGAGKIHRALNTLFGPLSQVFYPRLVLKNQKSSTLSKNLLIKLFIIMTGMGILFASTIFLFPTQIIQLLLGKDYLEAVTVLKWFGWVLPLTAISNVIGRQWMMVKSQEKPYGIILSMASLVSFAFVFISIPTYGINAIPFSMILFETITIGLILINRKFSIIGS